MIPHQPLVAAGAAVGAAALLGVHLRRRPDGFVPAILVRTGQFRAAAVLSLALAVVNFGILSAAPALLGDRTEWTVGEVGTALVFPYLVGGLASWFLVPVAAPGWLVGASAVAVLLVSLGLPTPFLLAAMTLGSLAAATGQGVLTVRATAAVPDGFRAATVGLINLCFLLGAAFGPAIGVLVFPAG